MAELQNGRIAGWQDFKNTCHLTLRAAGGQIRSHEDPSQRTTFLEQGGRNNYSRQLTLVKDIQPQFGFVGLFKNDADSCREFTVRSGSTRGPVVSSDTHPGAQKLPPHFLCYGRQREFVNEVNNVEKEPLRSGLEFFGFLVHGLGIRIRRAEARPTESQGIAGQNRSVLLNSAILPFCNPAISAIASSVSPVSVSDSR